MRNIGVDQEPLIRERDSSDSQRYGTEDSDDGTSRAAEVDESAMLRPGLFIWLLTFSAGISGLLFGYEYDTPSILL